jgi:hypothetical protein
MQEIDYSIWPKENEFNRVDETAEAFSRQFIWPPGGPSREKSGNR